MTRKKRGRLAFTLLVLASLAATGTVVGMVATSGGGAPRSMFSLEQAKSFTEFPVHSAGESVAGIPLVAVLRRADSANYVSFIYGECEAVAETGCAPAG